MSNFSSTPVQISNPVIPITTFTSVSITKQKPLVLCDIDDTVMGYDKDFEHFYDKLKMYIEKKKSTKAGPSTIFSTILNNNTALLSMTEQEIRITANNMFDDYRHSHKPKHCDYSGFVDLLQRVHELGGELQFLTARNKQSTPYTRQQFSQIGLKYDDYKVHYTGNIISKGDYITRFFNLHHFGEVVFIDDLDSYIKSVVVLCPSIQCYKFVRESKEN